MKKQKEDGPSHSAQRRRFAKSQPKLVCSRQGQVARHAAGARRRQILVSSRIWMTKRSKRSVFALKLPTAASSGKRRSNSIRGPGDGGRRHGARRLSSIRFDRKLIDKARVKLLRSISRWKNEMAQSD